MAGELKRLRKLTNWGDGYINGDVHTKDLQTALDLLERAYWRFYVLEKMEQETESDRKWLDDYKAAKGE